MVANIVIYTAIPKNLRKEAKAVFVFYPKETADLKAIHDKNDVLTDEELVVARNFLRESRYGSLYIQNEFPRRFELLNHI